MGNIDPQQELFTAYKLALEAMGYSVYDGCLPPEDTPYPFIYLGDFRQTDQMLKNAVMGNVYPTISVWHNNTQQRGTVSKMLSDIKWVVYNLDKKTLAKMNKDLGRDVEADDILTITTAEDNDNLVN